MRTQQSYGPSQAQQLCSLFPPFVRRGEGFFKFSQGSALDAPGEPIEALSAFRKLLSLEPRDSADHFGIGDTKQSLGRIKEVRRAFEHAVALASKFSPYHRVLAEAAEFSENDPRLVSLEELARGRASFSVDQKLQLYVALAKASDDRKCCELAFARLKGGDDIKRRSVSYVHRPVRH